MGKVKKNLLTSILLLVVMGIFAVLTIFVVVDAVNKKYYEDLNVDYEVQEEAPNIILTFARHEGSEVNNTTTKVVLNEEKDKFRLDGIVPEVTDGEVTNLDEITNENGGEFYFFSTNPAFIDVQETPEDPNLIFSETDKRYYVSTEENPIWYDVPTENVFTLYSVFLTPNVLNSDFANAPLNTITNAIVSHDVVDLPANAFSGTYSTSSALTTILLPQNLHSVGDYSFQYCGRLTTITIPEGVMNIGNYAFFYCSRVTSITIPSSVASIGENVFDGCDNLQYNEWDNGLYLGNESNPYLYLADTKTTVFETFSINSKCKIIGSDAFNSCIGLTSITIPSSVMSIGERAFFYCTGLTSITIPSTVTSIGSYAFSGCTGLTTVTFEEGSGLSSIESETFYGCTGLTSITIPSGVTSIGGYAFSGCSSLTSITIPSGVTSIGRYAFSGCTGLTTVTFKERSELVSIGERAFYNCESLTSISIPSGITSIGERAFYNCDNIQELYIDNLTSYLNISYADNYARPLYVADQSVTLYINGEAVIALKISEGIISIPDYAFYNCNFTSVTIPSTITSIGYNAFYGCYQLAEVYNLSSLDIVAGSYDNGYVGYYAIEIKTNEKSGYYNLGENNEFIMYKDLAGNHYLVNYVGSDIEIVLPTLVDGQTYSIYDYAFYEKSNITSITIPSGVTSIGERAFYNCTGLTSITIPSGVTSIGSWAFSYCRGLTTVTFEEGSKLSSIGDDAFYVCTGLTTVTFEEGSELKSIGDDAFYGCTGLTSITIPSSVTSIGSGAFYYCTNIQELHIDNLTSYLNISYGNDYARPLYGTNQSVTLYINGKAVTALKISEDITSIPSYAFRHCNFTSVTIPNSVASIGDKAFLSCDSLTTVTFEEGDELVSIGSGAFSDCYRLVEVYNLSSLNIWAGSTSNGYAGYYAIEIKKSEKSGIYTLGENKEFVMYKDLAGNHYLINYLGSYTEIVLPTLEGGQTYVINDYAFYEKSNITSITISSSVTSIGSDAFSDCTGLTTVTFEEGSELVSIGSDAFRYCNSLTSIAIPSSVTSIGSDAFSGCKGLTTVTFEEGSQLTSIGYYAFEDCSSLTSITIPSSVTTIGSYAFRDCSSLESVDFGENSMLTSIGSYAFEYCSSLTSITIPESVTSIARNAFYQCYKLVEVINLSSLEITAGSSSNGYVGFYADYVYTSLDTPLIQQKVGDYIFYLNDNVMYLLAYLGNNTNLTLPSVERVKEIFTDYTGSSYQIYEYAFYNNDNIASITIPSSVTSIGSNAFSGCTGLTTVTFKERSELISIGERAFYNCTGLTSITIPSTVTSIGNEVFRFCSNLTIYCEVASRPSGWNSSWNYSDCPVYWGLNVNWEYVDGEPRPI